MTLFFTHCILGSVEIHFCDHFVTSAHALWGNYKENKISILQILTVQLEPQWCKGSSKVSPTLEIRHKIHGCEKWNEKLNLKTEPYLNQMVKMTEFTVCVKKN